MFEKFQNLEEFLRPRENIIETPNSNFNEIIKGYNFVYISEKLDNMKNQQISQNIKDSKVIVIDYHQENILCRHDLHFIIGFKKTILIATKQSLQKTIEYILLYNPEINFNFISDNAKNIFDQYNNHCKIKESLLGSKDTFAIELYALNNNFHLKESRKFSSYSEIWKIIVPCISGYLIKQSYSKLNNDRLNKKCQKTIEKFDENMIKDDNFINLRTVGIGSIFKTELMIDIVHERLFLFKIPHYEIDEITKLIQREIKNYSKISHPFVPEFYGTILNNKRYNIIIEYINGQTLSDITNWHFSFEEKILIIFEIILVIYYFHTNNLIYRDLKPDNIMIDHNKNIVLIDFDRMIDLSNNGDFTKSFCTNYIAPEVNLGQITDKNDIYSIGQIINYIICENNPTNVKYYKNNETLFSIYKRCIKQNPNQRPSISLLLFFFL